MDEKSPRRPPARAAVRAATVVCAAIPVLTGATGAAGMSGHVPAARTPPPILYVADTNTNPGLVTPISTATNRAGRPVKAGPAPSAMVATPDGKTAYVANIDNFGPGTVTPIAIATNTAQRPITVGAGPTALVIAG